MTPRPLPLAFLGPAHTTDLYEFCYVRLRTIEREIATVRVVGHDVNDNMKKSTFRAHDTRTPRSYLVHPTAVVQPSGPCVDQWAYGVVVRYESISVALTEPLRVIKAGPITYTLQIGATVSDMMFNLRELQIQHDTGGRAGIVRPMVSVSFAPSDLISLVRPHDLRVHVLDCMTGSCKKNTQNLYKDPHATNSTDDRAGYGLRRGRAPATRRFTQYHEHVG
ncbi:hypothetical protein PHMEG_00020154 [Phytophthora megakarya]|uniref:Uncharacterized protein n=1 Tax=Phytophthora megakarya TaxID=4795 RepID=A0A225VQZ9_9STRA|nr:hypothetical protein PHMEG_00020154 [Phytophthora megakarya]